MNRGVNHRQELPALILQPSLDSSVGHSQQSENAPLIFSETLILMQTNLDLHSHHLPLHLVQSVLPKYADRLHPSCGGFQPGLEVELSTTRDVAPAQFPL